MKEQRWLKSCGTGTVGFQIAQVIQCMNSHGYVRVHILSGTLKAMCNPNIFTRILEIVPLYFNYCCFQFLFGYCYLYFGAFWVLFCKCNVHTHKENCVAQIVHQTFSVFSSCQSNLSVSFGIDCCIG